MSTTVSVTGLRARVERILSGGHRSDDIMALLLFARDRCDGRESVKEIGDFVAHHEERNKGLVTATTTDWVHIARFHGYALNSGGPIDSTRLPNYFPSYLSATMRRMNPKSFKGNEIGYKRARKLLPGIKENLVSNPDGTCRLSHLHTDVDIKLLNKLVSVIVVTPAFDGRQFATDLCEALKSNALLKRNEIDAFMLMEPLFSIFAASKMHNSVIDAAGLKISLKAAPSGDHLDVIAVVPIDMGAGKDVGIAAPIFSASMCLPDWCDSALLAETNPWHFDIEVTPEGKLARIG